jgi:hypothetical protein
MSSDKYFGLSMRYTKVHVRYNVSISVKLQDWATIWSWHSCILPVLLYLVSRLCPVFSILNRKNCFGNWICFAQVKEQGGTYSVESYRNSCFQSLDTRQTLDVESINQHIHVPAHEKHKSSPQKAKPKSKYNALQQPNITNNTSPSITKVTKSNHQTVYIKNMLIN